MVFVILKIEICDVMRSFLTLLHTRKFGGTAAENLFLTKKIQLDLH